MSTDIQIIGVARSSEVDRYARRRIAPILRDPRSGLEGVSVSIDRRSAGGPEGFGCRIMARVSSRLSLSVEKAGATVPAAIDAAADRLGWALGILHGGVGSARVLAPPGGSLPHDEDSAA